MQRICAWCKRAMEEKPGPVRHITHGICPDCRLDFIPKKEISLDRLLEKISAPVLVVDAECKVQYANSLARVVLGKELSAIQGLPTGNVFECDYAYLPEGCGNTQHCAGCWIRRTILATHATSDNVYQRKAYVSQRQAGGEVTRTCLLISTEKVQDAVLLRIDGSSSS